MSESTSSSHDIRVRALESFRKGISAINIAKVFQVHRATVHRWIARYKDEGDSGLVRKPVSGRPRKLESLDELGLGSIVLNPASKFGYETDFWTCGRLLQVIKKQFKIEMSKWTIWRRLRESGFTYQKPERAYYEADAAKRKKWIDEEIPKILETVNKHKAILYFEDESNISLSAILGKTWAPRGKTPKQSVTGKRGGISAMSAISKNGSLLFTLLEKRIASDEIIHFIKQILQYHKRRHIVLVMDQAKPHTSKKTTAYIESQKRLHVFYLPPYSPDWNPDEKVWNHLKHQELKGHQATTKKEMKSLAKKKLTKMSNNPHQLRGIFFRCPVAKLLQ